MKVDVLTVEDVKIPRWRWWSNWIDIAVVEYASRPWLLQMRISRTNAKGFRSINIFGRPEMTSVLSANAIGDLVPMRAAKVEA